MLKDLRTKDELASDVFKNALNEHSIVAITDIEGNIIYANDMFCKISKYSREELIGQNHRIIKSGIHPPSFYRNLWKTISSGKVWKGEICNRAKDGSLYWVKTVIMPILDNKKRIFRYIAIRTDITEIKELRERLLYLEKMAAIGELAARISHDIKNPLAVIRNSNEFLKFALEDKLDEKSKRILEHSNNAIERISHQINDVLDFVRKNPLKFQRCDLNEIINLAINTLRVPDNINITIKDKSQEIECDPFLLEVVFKNLIQNSIEAMEEGDITISCKESNKDIIIELQDSGPGIPNNIIDKIFDPLFTTKQKGTGLGLASVKRIIDDHGGKIAVRNNPTTFVIQIPKKPTKQA